MQADLNNKEPSKDFQHGWQALATWLISWFSLDLTPEQCGDVATLKYAIQEALNHATTHLPKSE